MRIVVTKARDGDKLIRQFLVRRFDRDFLLRPAIESGFTRQHELAIAESRLGGAKLGILWMGFPDAFKRAGIALQPQCLERFGLFFQVFKRWICR